MHNRRIISDEEILSLYVSGVRDFTPYIVSLAEPERMNLSGVDFSGQDLCECYMPGINFSGANLRNVGLIQSNLDGADLSGADLNGASLVSTSFIGTNLTNTNLTNAFLEGTRFSDCIFTGSNFTGIDMNEGQFRRNIYQSTIMPDGSIKTGTD